jgi:hypothetical protein
MMSTGTIQLPARWPLSEADEDSIRAALFSLDPDGRLALYAYHAALDDAARTGNRRALHDLVMATEDGTPLRRCVAQLAGRRLDALDLAARTPPNLTPPRRLPRRPEHRPRHVIAHVGNIGTWAARATHWHTWADLDLDGAERFGKEPRAVYWRHIAHTPIGLTRSVYIDERGDIIAELELAATRAGEIAASLCHDRAIKFSIGTGHGNPYFETIYEPANWSPQDGAADRIAWYSSRLAEVSLTDSPLYESTGVRVTWQ